MDSSLFIRRLTLSLWVYKIRINIIIKKYSFSKFGLKKLKIGIIKVAEIDPSEEYLEIKKIINQDIANTNTKI